MIELFDFEEEEDREKESMTLALKKFTYPIKFLFQKYSNQTN